MKLGKNNCRIIALLAIIGLILVAASCGKAPVKTAVPELTPEERARITAEEEARRKMEAERLKQGRTMEESLAELYASKEEVKALQEFQNEDIHFAFDSYVLSPEAQKILDKKVAWLRKHPDIKIIIEGHCDERGSNEYNLALGERRANSAKEYLVNAGIDPDRIHTISYGEERPLALGSDEASWAINRRAHFVVWKK